MSFDKVTRTTAVCDGCGPDWWESMSEDLPIFNSRAEARKELVGTFEWRLERQIDGSFHMLCATCAGIAECAKYGHDWVVANEDAPEHLQGTPPTCHRCNKVRSDDAPPADHPDSEPVEISATEEAVLDALDAEFTEVRKEN